MAKALRTVLASLLAGEDQDIDALRVIDGGDQYKPVAASATDFVLGAVGAAGDYLDSLVIVVSAAATSQVQIRDGAGAPITVFPASPGGGIGTYPIHLGIRSTAGAWKITTGAGVSVIATGRFT